jgi:hypothetical protein
MEEAREKEGKKGGRKKEVGRTKVRETGKKEEKRGKEESKMK